MNFTNIKNIILLFSLLLSTLSISAQNVDQFEFFSHTLKYSENSNTYYNSIFEDIAKASSKNKFSPSFQYNLTLKHNIQVIEKNKYRLTVSLSDINVIGDTKLNLFDFSSLVIPSEIECTMYLMGNSSQIFSKINLSILPNSNSPFLIADTIIQLNKPITDIKIRYDNFKYFIKTETYLKFKNFFQIIDEYNKSQKEFEQAFKTLKSFNLKEIDMIQVYDIKLDEIEVYFNNLEQLAIPEKLKLSKSDPTDFINNSQQLRLQIGYYRKNLNSLLANLDYYYAEDAFNHALMSDTTKAIELYNKAIALNFLNTKSQIELTKIEVAKNKTENTAKRLIHFFKTYKPYGNEGQKVMEALYLLHDLYLNQGASLNRQIKYNEAIVEFEKCYFLCDNISVLTCSDILYKSMQEAKTGLYNSYISVIEKAIQQKLWNMAETYVKQAKTFQEANSSYIKSNTKTDELLYKVYERYIVLAEKNYQIGSFVTAIDYYSKSIAICEKHQIKCSDIISSGIKKCKYGIYYQFIQSALNALADSAINKTEEYIQKAKNYQNENPEIASYRTADSLLGKLKDVFYQQYIVFGQKLLLDFKYQEALSSFIKARKIETDFLVTTSPELPLLLKNSTKEFIFRNKDNVEYLIWANKFDSVYKIIDQYNYLVDVSNSSKDTLLINYILKTKEKTTAKFCFNLSIEHERCISLANTNISSQNFTTAIDYLNKAIQISKISKYCTIDTIKTHNTIINISPASEYQILTTEARRLFNQTKYSQSVLKIRAAELLYNNKDLSRFDIKQTTTAEFIAQNKNLILIDSAIVVLKKEKEYYTILDIINKSKANRLTTKISKKTERELAKILSSIDFKANPRIGSKDFYLQYANYLNLNRFKIYYKLHLIKLKSGLFKY